MSCSNCLISTDFLQSCAPEYKIMGGNNAKIYILPFCQVTSFAENANNEITGITVSSGATFYEVDTNKDSLTTTESLVSPASRLINQSITFNLPLMASGSSLTNAAANATNWVQDLVDSRGSYLVIVETKNKLKFAYGVGAGLEVETVEKTSGAVSTDIPTYAITLSGVQPEFSQILTSSVVLA